MTRWPALLITTSAGLVSFVATPRGLQVVLDSSAMVPKPTHRFELTVTQRRQLRQFLTEHYPEDEYQ